MPYTDMKSVTAALKKGELSSIYYIYGQNVTDVEKLTKRIIRTALGENEEIALTRLNGKELDFSELSDMVQMMPMMADYNCILINDYNCERPREDMRGHKAEDFNKKLVEAVKEIPPMTIVIFNVTGFDVKTKYDKKTRSTAIADRNKKLADLAAKNGVAVECGIKSPENMAKDIAASISARGSCISLGDARELAEMCQFDTLTIRNEIDKLCAYAGSSEITRDMIHKLVHRQSNVTAFKLAEAVAAMRRKEAYEALDELMADKDNRGSVLAAISSSFTDMYRAACAGRTGRSVDAVMSDFGYIWKFKVENAFRDSSRMSIERLRKCMALIRDTAVKMNSSKTDEKTMLEQMITKMLIAKN